MCAAVTLQTFREKGWQHVLEEMPHSSSDVGYPYPSLYRTSIVAASGLRGVGVSYQLASRFDNIPTGARGWCLVLYTCPKEPNYMFKTAEL